MIAASQIRVETSGQHLRQDAGGSSSAMYPSHETGVRIAGCVRQNVAQESAMNRGKVGRRVRHRLAKALPHLAGNRLPDGTLTDVLDIVESILEHLVGLNPECRPVGGVERFACHADGSQSPYILMFPPKPDWIR